MIKALINAIGYYTRRERWPRKRAECAKDANLFRGTQLRISVRDYDNYLRRTIKFVIDRDALRHADRLYLSALFNRGLIGILIFVYILNTVTTITYCILGNREDYYHVQINFVITTRRLINISCLSCNQYYGYSLLISAHRVDFTSPSEICNYF